MSTIHIFAYGEAQIISKDLNYKTDKTKFSKLQAVVDNIKSKKPADVQVSEYHAINIFDGQRVSYLAKEKEGSFSVKFADVDSAKLDALKAEFKTLHDAEPIPAK